MFQGDVVTLRVERGVSRAVGPCGAMTSVHPTGGVLARPPLAGCPAGGESGATDSVPERNAAIVLLGGRCRRTPLGDRVPMASRYAERYFRRESFQ
jgi:hypothetical protein